MADITNLSNFLGDIASAIREKKGTTEPIPAQEFDSEIATIETGVNTDDANANPADILSPKTAYVNGEKIEGSIATEYIKTNVSWKLAERAGGTNPAIFGVNDKYLFYYNPNSRNFVIEDIETGTKNTLPSNVYSFTTGDWASIVLGCIRNENECFGIAVSNGSNQGLFVYIKEGEIISYKVQEVNTYNRCLLLTPGRTHANLFCSEYRSNSSGGKSMRIFTLNDDLTFSYSTVIYMAYSDYSIIGAFTGNDDYYISISGSGTGTTMKTMYMKRLVWNGTTLTGVNSVTNPVSGIYYCNGAMTHLISGTTLYTLTLNGNSVTATQYGTVSYNGTGLFFLNNYFITYSGTKVYVYELTDKLTLQLLNTFVLSATVNLQYVNNNNNQGLFEQGQYMQYLYVSGEDLLVSLTRQSETYYNPYNADVSGNDIRLGKIAYGANGKVVGTLLDVAQIGGSSDGEVNVYADSIGISETNDQDLIVRNGASILATTSNEKMATAIGLTSDKLVSGNTVLGVEGTAETSAGITPLTIVDPEIPGFTPSYTVETVAGQTYGFTLEGSTYKNTNQGQDSTTAYCKVNISTPHDADIKLICTQDSENNFDYGSVSDVDTQVYNTSFQGKSGSFEQPLFVPAGDHYFYVKYQKDGSASNGSDTFTFMLDFSNCTGKPETTYTVNVTHFATKEDMLADTTCPTDTYAVVYGFGRELISEVWCKKANGWVFTGVSNDPNLVPKNILRGIKIGEITGGYISGYNIDDNGNIPISVSTHPKVFPLNEHNNSLRVMSAYLDPTNNLHLSIQYETYDVIPVQFTWSDISFAFSTPDSEGVTSLMEVLIPANLNIVHNQLSADYLDLNLEWEETPLEIRYADNIVALPGTEVTAKLLYNELFNVYKQSVTLSHSDEAVTGNIEVNIQYLELGESWSTGFMISNNSTNTTDSAQKTLTTVPTELLITDMTYSVMADSVSENYSSELDGVTYNYYIYACYRIYCRHDGSGRIHYWTNANGFVTEGQMIKYDVNITFGDYNTAESCAMSDGNQLNEEILLEAGTLNPDTFASTTPEISVTNNAIELVVPTDVLVAESWAVYNNMGNQVDTISNLVINGDYIHGYTMTGTLTYDKAFRFKVWSSNAEAILFTSGEQSSPTVSWSMYVQDKDYDFESIYIEIFRQDYASDSEYYDPTNPTVTVNEDGSVVNELSYADEEHGFSTTITFGITDILSPSYGGYIEVRGTITNPDVFAQYALSRKGYEAYTNGETISRMLNDRIITWDCYNLNEELVTLNTFPPVHITLDKTTGSFWLSMANSAGEQIMSIRRVEFHVLISASNTEVVSEDGLMVKDIETGSLWYDDGNMYVVTYESVPIYEFTASGDRLYSKQELIAAYATDKYLNSRFFDSDYNEFSGKYVEFGRMNYGLYALMGQDEQRVTDVIIEDNVHNTYMAAVYRNSNVTGKKLVFTANGQESYATQYAIVENAPLFGETVYFYPYGGILTTSENNPVEVDM